MSKINSFGSAMFMEGYTTNFGHAFSFQVWPTVERVAEFCSVSSEIRWRYKEEKEDKSVVFLTGAALDFISAIYFHSGKIYK